MVKLRIITLDTLLPEDLQKTLPDKRRNTWTHQMQTKLQRFNVY